MSIEILFAHATQVRLNAYAPYSHFLVGACLETTNGKLFSGCNVENASYGVSICAESNAIATMIAAGEREIRQIAILAEGPGVCAPCGACRQRLFEFAIPDMLVHLGNLTGMRNMLKLNDLFPYAFGPKDLLEK